MLEKKNYKIIKVQRDIQKCIALYISEDAYLSDEQVTILDVDVDKNFSRAKIYYVTLTDEPSEKLEQSKGVIRNVIARNFRNRIRRIPEPIFIYDRTEENARKMDKIIDEH